MYIQTAVKLRIPSTNYLLKGIFIHLLLVSIRKKIGIEELHFV